MAGFTYEELVVRDKCSLERLGSERGVEEASACGHIERLIGPAESCMQAGIVVRRWLLPRISDEYVVDVGPQTDAVHAVSSPKEVQLGQGISKHVTNTQGKQSALGSLTATRLDWKFTD